MRGDTNTTTKGKVHYDLYIKIKSLYNRSTPKNVVWLFV